MLTSQKQELFLPSFIINKLTKLFFLQNLAISGCWWTTPYQFNNFYLDKDFHDAKQCLTQASLISFYLATHTYQPIRER